eukprot:COSAG05_NODE_4284_length_1584_cov_1.119865_3_plen_31_part_01
MAVAQVTSFSSRELKEVTWATAEHAISPEKT